MNAAEVDDGRDFHQHVDRLIRAMDRLLTDSKLGALERKSESYPIRDVTALLPLPDEPATRTDQLADKRHVQTETVSKNSAAFTAFVAREKWWPGFPGRGVGTTQAIDAESATRARHRQ